MPSLPKAMSLCTTSLGVLIAADAAVSVLPAESGAAACVVAIWRGTSDVTLDS